MTEGAKIYIDWSWERRGDGDRHWQAATFVEMVQARFSGCGRVDGCREVALHPSRETATTIVASEPRLVAAHVVYTLAWFLVLLGWALCGPARRDGTAGIGRFLTAFSGTYLIAVTGNFGFLARFWPNSHRRCWTPLTNICRW
jgi:hypothetical protein